MPLYTYTYGSSEFTSSGGGVNTQKLFIEVQAPTDIPNPIEEPRRVKARTDITFDVELTAQQVTDLNAIIAAHDGQPAPIFNRQARLDNAERLAELGVFNIDIDTNELEDYLIELNAYLDVYINLGITRRIHEKIAADAANVSHPRNAFLTFVIPNSGGRQVWQFIISNLT